MSSPEQDRRPTGAIDVRIDPGADETPQAQAHAKRAWTPPTVTTFKVTDTQGGVFNIPADGSNNSSNNPLA